jgi:hypothetical protein
LGFFVGIEYAEDARRFNEPAIARDGAAGRIPISLKNVLLLKDGVPSACNRDISLSASSSLMDAVVVLGVL